MWGYRKPEISTSNEIGKGAKGKKSHQNQFCTCTKISQGRVTCSRATASPFFIGKKIRFLSSKHRLWRTSTPSEIKMAVRLLLNSTRFFRRYKCSNTAISFCLPLFGREWGIVSFPLKPLHLYLWDKQFCFLLHQWHTR